MLSKFSFSNFGPFREEAVLDLKANSVSEHPENVASNGVLKSSVIYGANGSGKSTVIRALRFYVDFLRFSFAESSSEEAIRVRPFALDEISCTKPSMFEGVFVTADGEYRYGFGVTSERVVEEWLFLRKPGSRETKLLIRDGTRITLHRHLRKALALTENPPKRALFLSICQSLNIPQTVSFYKAQRKLMVVNGTMDSHLWRIASLFIHSNKANLAFVAEVLKAADIGIRNFEQKVESPAEVDELFSKIGETDDAQMRDELAGKILQKKFNITCQHDRKLANGRKGLLDFDLFKEESDGTQKLYAIAGVMAATLSSGMTFIFDEFDARIHPLIAKNLVLLFNNLGNSRAQLIVTTHDTNLLANAHLRRDQIWFTEKNTDGESTLYSLADFKIDSARVRKDASFENDYIEGRYGGIPYLGDFNLLLRSHSSSKAINPPDVIPGSK